MMPKNKTMYNKGIIIAGLAVFLVLVTFPFWYNLGKAAPAPERILTTQAKAAKECVLPVELIRTEHMQMLNDWRNTVVRDGMRLYVESNGKKYEMSLSNTCLDCHSNKPEFCDRCHNYAAVTPYCWDCHIDNPKEIK
jgi:hypothetical protein